jgi:hypothetical protein
MNPFDKGDVICGGTVLRFYDIFFVMNRLSMMSALVIRVIRPAYPLSTASSNVFMIMAKFLHLV